MLICKSSKETLFKGNLRIHGKETAGHTSIQLLFDFPFVGFKQRRTLATKRHSGSSSLF